MRLNKFQPYIVMDRRQIGQGTMQHSMSSYGFSFLFHSCDEMTPQKEMGRGQERVDFILASVIERSQSRNSSRHHEEGLLEGSQPGQCSTFFQSPSHQPMDGTSHIWLGPRTSFFSGDSRWQQVNKN